MRLRQFLIIIGPAPGQGFGNVLKRFETVLDQLEITKRLTKSHINKKKSIKSQNRSGSCDFM